MREWFDLIYFFWWMDGSGIGFLLVFGGIDFDEIGLASLIKELMEWIEMN